MPGFALDLLHVHARLESRASNLVSHDQNDKSDVFLFDRTLGTTTRLSLGQAGLEAGVEADGDSRAPTISGDGKSVAFQSQASNLVPGDKNARPDLFVVRIEDGRIRRLSVGAGGAAGQEANGASHTAALSHDGKRVVFESLASNLVPGDENGKEDVFVRDLSQDRTYCMSRSLLGSHRGGSSQRPRISSDGAWAAFDTQNDNLVPDPTEHEDVVLVDLGGLSDDSLKLLTRFPGAPPAKDIRRPQISDDGKTVVCVARAVHLGQIGTGNELDAYVIDPASGQVEALNISDQGVKRRSGHATVSSDGRFAAFDGNPRQLPGAPGETPTAIYWRDRKLSLTRRVDSKIPGDGQRVCVYPVISSDGKHVVFASNLEVSFLRRHGSASGRTQMAGFASQRASIPNPMPSRLGSGEANSRLR